MFGKLDIKLALSAQFGQERETQGILYCHTHSREGVGYLVFREGTDILRYFMGNVHHSNF